ncbi:hypothetical protein [Kitasatospora indigofera]|uniref:hypothetical protein n=1 Tax=Kitasatospora indigofera TaxID=67307 RepID=UPI00167D0CE7|nr:hypothetical protein [Kitasatospora indigofera]
MAILPGTADAATVTTNRTGTDGGYFHSFWSEGTGAASMSSSPPPTARATPGA